MTWTDLGGVEHDGEPPELLCFDADGNEIRAAVRTKSGRYLTAEIIEELAREAEVGYDVDRISLTDLKRKYRHDELPDDDGCPNDDP